MSATGLETCKRIKLAYRYDEGQGYIVYAPRGFGKSSFKFHVAAEVLSTSKDPPDWDAIKKWLVFTPKEFVDIVLRTYSMRPVLLWDDAGYWLNRLFWYEPFVKETMRYITLQRTQFAAVMFSTPSLRFLPSKLIELEDVFRVKILKEESNQDTPNSRPRIAWVKRPWYSDDLKRHGATTVWRDQFSALMPDHFYRWYEPLRDSYLKIATERLRSALLRKTAREQRLEREALEVIEPELGRTIPAPEKVSELAETIEHFI